MQFIEEKMYIGLEHAPPTFDVRNKILGTEVGQLLKTLDCLTSFMVLSDKITRNLCTFN